MSKPVGLSLSFFSFQPAEAKECDSGGGPTWTGVAMSR